MEEFDTPVKQINFVGSGSKLFGIYIVNLFLTVITLGLYYPWAKAKVLQYLYQETELEESRFKFHGTGKEMFKGFIKAVGIIAALYAVLLVSQHSENVVAAIAGLVFYVIAILALVPVAIHGALKYRMSRTSWRGIHFGYRGELKALFGEFIKGAILTVITFGIYGPWFTVNLRKYILGNIRFGNVEFSYTGDGSELFWLIVKGYFFTLFTLGIYMFWFAKDIINYYLDNIQLNQEGREIKVQSYLTAGQYFSLVMGNALIVIFTLGLGAPWATVRSLRILFSNITIEGELDLDALEQTEKAYKDATGEDVADMLDIGII